MQFEVIASVRVEQGTSASRRLRRTEKVPAVVYGGGQLAVAVTLDHNELAKQLRKEAFHSSILTLTVDGQKEPVLLRDVQMHPYKRRILHVDFQRVDPNQEIHIKVPLHFVNAELSPGVKLSQGIVNHVLTELDVLCLPAHLPEYIEVDLKDMMPGHSLHVSDLKLPEGVRSVNLIRGENPAVAGIAGATEGSSGSDIVVDVESEAK